MHCLHFVDFKKGKKSEYTRKKIHHSSDPLEKHHSILLLLHRYFVLIDVKPSDLTIKWGGEGERHTVRKEKFNAYSTG